MEKNTIIRKTIAKAPMQATLLVILLMLISSSDIFAQGTIIDNGSTNNKWIFHNPNDSRKMLFLAPRNSSNSNWDWSKQTIFDNNGDVFFSGKVGVGSSTFTTATNYRLFVNGNMWATRVYANYVQGASMRVTSPDGADFVFEENYALPSLTDVESYIKAHNHLPEILSADEMKVEGLELGTFTIKLLQKIEELTLYTIKQENRIKALEEKIGSSQTSVQK